MFAFITLFGERDRPTTALQRPYLVLLVRMYRCRALTAATMTPILLIGRLDTTHSGTLLFNGCCAAPTSPC
jgi:hypothetical protein